MKKETAWRGLCSLSGLYCLTAAYLCTSLYLFFLGWLTAWASILTTLTFTAGIVFSLKPVVEAHRGERLLSGWADTLIAFVSLLVFFTLAGHTDLFSQGFDWHKHHAVFYDLMNYSWPVVYDDGSLLTYYLGQYIVPAFIGKLFSGSHTALRIGILLWNALGVLLTYLCLTSYLRADTVLKKALVLFFLLVWGGCTNIGEALYTWLRGEAVSFVPISFKWLDMDRIRVHYASNYDAVRGGFQHVIPVWVATAFFLGNRKIRESYVLIVLPLVFSATFGAVYLAALLLFFAVYDLVKEKDIRAWLRSVFSPGNLLLLPAAAVLLVYFYGNLSVDKPDSVGFSFLRLWEYPDFFLIFVFTEFLGYGLFLWRRNRTDPMFYAVLLELLLIPFFSLGMWNDLCARGSLPARFILMTFCVDAVLNGSRRDWRNWGLGVLLLCTVLMTAYEFLVHMNMTFDNWDTKSFLCDDYGTLNGFAGNPDIRQDEAYNYFTPDYENSPFYTIARK